MHWKDDPDLLGTAVKAVADKMMCQPFWCGAGEVLTTRDLDMILAGTSTYAALQYRLRRNVLKLLQPPERGETA